MSKKTFFDTLKHNMTVVSSCLTIFLSLGFTIFIYNPLTRIIAFIGLLLVIICLAVIKSLFRRKKIKIIVKDKLEMEVFFHKYDEYHEFIFNSEDEDIFVVPVNRYFDTHIDDGIIQLNSNIGRIIQKYFSKKSDLVQLDEYIYKTLEEIPEKYEENINKKGKIRKYNIGTIVRHEIKGKEIYFLALTDVDIYNNSKSFCTPEMFCEAVNKLINYIDNHSEGKTVNMPLLGTHKSRLKTTQDIALNLLIDLFMISEHHLKNPIRIALSKKYNKLISLDRFQK